MSKYSIILNEKQSNGINELKSYSH
uniref:Uncharacterized protein n=1 Tax=Anguilla anguilla TaxID=7936 RepID=A0A0E9V9K0_ANGAN